VLLASIRLVARPWLVKDQAEKRVRSGGDAIQTRHGNRARALWLSVIEAGTATIDDIATREGCSTRHVNMTISLAFLAPPLVSAVGGERMPHGVGIARLCDAPVAWERQRHMLGLAE
jgi:hypothetical protein